MTKYVSMTIRTQDYDKGHKDKKNKYYKSFLEMQKHNNRTEEMSEGYLLNKEYTYKNVHKSFKETKTILNNFMQIKADYKNFYKKNMPTNTKALIDGIITFSDTMQEDINKYGIQTIFNAVVGFLKEEFGNSVISVDLHLDETTPHFHFSLLNYDIKTHQTISQKMLKSIKKEEDKRNYYQDRLATYLQNHIDGFDYQRGIIRNIKQYHSERKKQHDHLKKQAQKIQEYEQQLQEYEQQLQAQKDENKALKDEQSILLSSIKNLEQKWIDNISQIIKDLEELNKEEDISNFLKKLFRYVKNDNRNKLENLIQKYQKALTKGKQQIQSNKKLPTPF